MQLLLTLLILWAFKLTTLPLGDINPVFFTRSFWFFCQVVSHFRLNVAVATAVADSMVYDKKRKAA